MLCTSPGTASVVPAGVTVTSWATRTLPSWASGRSTVTTAAPGPTRTTPDDVLACSPLTRSTCPTRPLIGAFSTAPSRSCSAPASSWVALSTSTSRLAADCAPPAPPVPPVEPVPVAGVPLPDAVPVAEPVPVVGPLEPWVAALDCCSCSAVAAASSATTSRSISDAVCWAEVSALDSAWMQALTCSGVGVPAASVRRLAGRTVAVSVSSAAGAVPLGDAVADGSPLGVCEGDGLGVGEVVSLGVGVRRRCGGRIGVGRGAGVDDRLARGHRGLNQRVELVDGPVHRRGVDALGRRRRRSGRGRRRTPIRTRPRPTWWGPTRSRRGRWTRSRSRWRTSCCSSWRRRERPVPQRGSPGRR